MGKFLRTLLHPIKKHSDLEKDELSRHLAKASSDNSRAVVRLADVLSEMLDARSTINRI